MCIGSDPWLVVCLLADHSFARVTLLFLALLFLDPFAYYAYRAAPVDELLQPPRKQQRALLL
jgi:hypothetical protein